MKRPELIGWILLALKFKGEKALFLLTRREFETLVRSDFLSLAPEDKRDRFDYSFSALDKIYYLRSFQSDKFLLFSRKLWTKELCSFKRLKELERAYTVVKLSSWIREQKMQESVRLGITVQNNWGLKFDDSLFFQLARLVEGSQTRINALDWASSREEKYLDWVSFSFFLAKEERAAELVFKLKRREKKRIKNLKLESHFSSRDVFDSYHVGSSAQLENASLQERERGQEEFLELLPSPFEEYKEILSQLPREKVKGRYFNSHFPFNTVLELNNSYYIWTSISPQYRGVDLFVLKLKDYYCSLTPRELDSLVESGGDSDSHLWRSLQSQISCKSFHSSESSFKGVLETKLKDLQQKNEDLNNQLQLLKSGLLEEGKHPETDMLYLHSLREKQSILEEIERTFELLNNYSEKMSRYSEKHLDFSPNLYLSIFGTKAIFTRYDSLVCEALFSLNEQLNEIVFYQREIEKVLFERLSILHRARKSELKLEFLAEENLSSLLLKKERMRVSGERAEKKKELEMKGALELSKSNIQAEIEREKAKLANYLGRLKELDYYPNYEEQARKLRAKKAEFEKKVEDYREEIYALKLKVESVEREYSAFISTIKEEVLGMQREIGEHYSSHLELVNHSVAAIWADWAEKGVSYIEKILSRRKRLVREFSEIIVLELKNMYSSQDNLLAEARERKKEWERVYSEIVDEFKTLGYYLSKPKPSEYYYKFLPKLDKSTLRLSPEIKKLIYYRPSLKYTTPKVNELIGLSPKLLDSKEFLVLDQVWTKLTPLQEQQLREKLKKEAEELDQQRLEELFKKTKAELEKRLKVRDYSLKTLALERDFPLEVDQEERKNRLREREKDKLENWRELHFTTSEIRYRFKGLLMNLSKKLFTLKGVEQWGKDLNITDKGKWDDPAEVEKLSERDYFTKFEDGISLVDGGSLSSFRPEESELYDIEDESYLSILEALEEDKERIKEKLNPPKKSLMPTLEEWANLNLKRYREEKKKVDIVEVKEGLLALEREIESLNRASGNYKEACENERNRREYLVSEIAGELKELKRYFETEEGELHRIFSEASDMIEISFEKIDRELDERRKKVLELQRKKMEQSYHLNKR